MFSRSTLFIFALAAAFARSASAAENADFEHAIKPFLAKHCAECHGAEVQKAKLRLDTLAPEFNTRDTAATWIKSLDKITSGQMPPASEERPPKEALAAATTFLTAQLQQSSLAKQQREGRVLLRRLNRTEYENTLSDLLAMQVDVKELLPDDAVVAGFDNISEGLDISSSHLLRYQEAAEKALAAAVPLRTKSPFKERRTTAQQLEGSSGLKKGMGQLCKMDGESLMLYARMPRYLSLTTPRAPTNGRFKVRVSAKAVNTGGLSIPVAFHYFNEHVRDEGEVRGCIDVPCDKTTIIELDVDLHFNDKLLVNGWSLPWQGDFQREHKELPKDFAGPGLVIDWIEMEGPFNDFPDQSYRRLFGDVPLKAKSVADAEAKKAKIPVIKDKRSEYEWMHDPLIPASTDPKKDAERLLRDFIPRAARRPVTEEAINYFVQFAHARLDKGYSFGDAMFSAYRAVLCSPIFLFLEEQPGKLNDDSLASRLSYFLWRSMPDAALLDLAAKKTLSKPDVLHAEVERMLNDPKAQRFIEDFTGQWLELNKINATSPDPQLYGEFDQYLLWSMPRETHMFFAEILKQDLSITNFIQSDWTFVNARLAQHYGIKGVSGNALTKVALTPDLHRGGVLTQGSVLKVTADGTRTSPIIRGKWVLEHIVGKPPTPPPPDVPSIEPDIRGAATIRQQLEKHRNTKACAACHQYIDPPGFALETYDVIGNWRDFYRLAKATNKQPRVDVEHYPGRKTFRGLDVEKGDKTPDGRVFKDIDEYKQILLEDKDQLARNIVQKLMIFSTGAIIQFADREVVEQIVADARKKNYGLRTIIHDIVGSRVFLNK